MNDEERHEKIIDFINLHAGCSVEECFNGVKEHMARSTFFKILSQLKADNEVIVENHNKRDQKLFLNKNNLLVSVPKELEQFELVFEQLFKKASQKVRTSMMERNFNDMLKSVGCPNLLNTSEHIPQNQTQQLAEMIISIFFRMIDSYLLRSLIEWPRKIQNRETLKKLYDIVFTKLANILLKFTQNDEHSRFYKIYLESYLDKRIRGADFLLDLQIVFNSFGMQREIEPVIDSLWDIDQEIQQLVYKEPKLFGFNFNFKIEDWRKLLELCVLHVEDSKPDSDE